MRIVEPLTSLGAERNLIILLVSHDQGVVARPAVAAAPAVRCRHVAADLDCPVD
ncbi:hypothetical protein [Actinoplanes sp. NPDC051851]|uniref:hypothetical protein n=1 Tax=Actinoplanes sp. NPDC051851 TaxID=3154753 RepID=UPI003426DC24